jgi:capsid protein
MSIVVQLSNLITRIGTEFKSVRSTTGALTDLSTTTKSSLVGAINEVKAALASASQINDAAASTTTAYSSQKVTDLLATLKSDILGGASAAYDTLQELATLIQSDESGISSLTTAVGNRVRFDAAQTLTSGQQAQAIANIGAIAAADVGDVTTDFVAQFNTAIA